MPRYDYQCESCEHVFEISRKRTEPGPGECPECGAADPKQLISATSFKLKGTGWYATDYRSPGLAKGVGTMPEPSTASAKSTDSAGTSDAATTSSDSSTTSDSASSSSSSDSSD